jgi:hypothetical protein
MRNIPLSQSLLAAFGQFVTMACTTINDDSIMRAYRLWPALAFTLFAAHAGAQTPSATPPQLEKIEEVDNPITVTNKDTEKKITEKREGGVVTEAKVKTGKTSYTVKRNMPAGSALPGDAAGLANRGGTTWTVMEFDIASKKKKRSAESADKDEAPPPPPAAPAAPSATSR